MYYFYSILSFSLLTQLAASIFFPAYGIVFGVKSRASGGLNVSSPPSVLYTFEEDGSNFSEIGILTLSGTAIDVDGLAISRDFGLIGFHVKQNQSQLLSIDPLTAVTTAIGDPILGREIRGATFDLQENLLTIDVTENELISIDPLSGAILNQLSLSEDIRNPTDIAVDLDGNFFVSSSSKVSSLNRETGILSDVFIDPSLAYAGITFSEVEGNSKIFGYEINSTDDVFSLTLPEFNRSTVYSHIIPRFNSGRGDLASVLPTQPINEPSGSVPEPSTLLGLISLLSLARVFNRQ
ncbi:MAG: PEP-CTERM sorting domain-containing protein [Cyanobacteria bacterium P01_G01_bin.54]